MASNDLLKRLVDAGMTFTAMSQARAEDLVKDLVKQGDVRRKEAKKLASELVERGREGTEKLLEMVQSEVARQLARFADRMDEVEVKIEDLAEKLADVPEKAAAAVKKAAPAAKKAPAAAVKKAAPAAKKAPAAAVKKAPAAKKAAPAAKKAAPAAKKAAAT